MTVQQLPVIGITCAEIRPEGGPTPPRWGQNQSYVRAVVRAGAAPLLIPPLADKTRLCRLFGLLDGLLLPGGEDVNPINYGEPPHENLRQVAPLRDETELALARWAMAEGKPLLAICRGIQVLNVALGGSLYQDIQAQLPQAQKHDWFRGYPRNYLPHSVEVTPGSRLAGILGTTTLPVNSLHHQAVKAIAPGLAAVARAPDQIIEALEAPEQPFALAVQWHPEELSDEDPRAQRLFDALVEACQT